MIRKLVTSAAALVLLAGSGLLPLDRVHAQDYGGIDAEPALWKIEQDDATVWLFGTFHLLPPSLDWRTEPVTGALQAADIVWFEADVQSPQAQQRTVELVPQLGMNPPGVTLSSLLDEETGELLERIAPAIGAPPAALDPLRPWLVGLTLAVMQIQQLGFDPAAGVESILHAEAQAAGKAFRYFETIDEQLGFFAGLPSEVEIEMLAQTLRDMEELPAQLDEMVVAWATGDLGTLDEAVNASVRDTSPEVYEALLVERNRNWIPDITAMLDEGGTHFVAVGAGHLVGEDSVIALLEAEGVRVERQ